MGQWAQMTAQEVQSGCQEHGCQENAAALDTLPKEAVNFLQLAF